MLVVMKTHVYIDGTNLYKSAHELGFEIDYKKMYGWLCQKYRPDRIYLFLGFVERMTHLYDYLKICGYVVELKKTVYFGTYKIKGNCDTEMVLKIMIDLYKHQVGKFILVTGDGDFKCVIDHIIESGKQFHIVAPNEKRCSILLKHFYEHITYLNTLYHKFSYAKSYKKETPGADASAQGFSS